MITVYGIKTCGSDLYNNAFERTYRTSDSLQSYLGLWLHDKKWVVGMKSFIKIFFYNRVEKFLL